MLTGYSVAHLSLTCARHAATLEAIQFESRSALFWCKRAVRWGADWLLKTHVSAAPKNTWQDRKSVV